MRFQCVGWAKRSVPTCPSAYGKDAPGPGQDAPLPASALLPLVAAKFSTTCSWLGNRKRRRAFYPAEETSIECAI
jgi:hypothetical protein